MRSRYINCRRYLLAITGVVWTAVKGCYAHSPVGKLRPAALNSNSTPHNSFLVFRPQCSISFAGSLGVQDMPPFRPEITEALSGNAVTLLTAWYSSLWDKEHLRCWRQCGRTPNFLFRPWCTPLRRHEYTDIEHPCLLSSMA